MTKRLEVALSIGDFLDVMDCEGTWNVARVLDIQSQTKVEVEYDGWDSTYNEVVDLNSERVAPYHTFTWSVRCWARYKNWPWWPAVVTIRAPGTNFGITYLKSETRLYVDFLDKPGLEGRTICWVEKDRVQSFDTNKESRCRRTGADFVASYTRALQSTAGEIFPRFLQGTLAIEYATAPTPSIKATRKLMGALAWQNGFVHNRSRHQHIFQYDMKIEKIVNSKKTPEKKNKKPSSIDSKESTPDKVVEKHVPLHEQENPAPVKSEIPEISRVQLSPKAKRLRHNVLGPDPDEMSIIVLPSDDSDEEQTSWLPNKNTTTAMLSSSATVSVPIQNTSITVTNQDDILENDTSSMEEVEGNDYEPDIVDDEGSNEELIPLDPLDDWGMMRPTSDASSSSINMQQENKTSSLSHSAETSAVGAGIPVHDSMREDEMPTDINKDNVLEHFESILSTDKNDSNMDLCGEQGDMRTVVQELNLEISPRPTAIARNREKEEIKVVEGNQGLCPVKAFGRSPTSKTINLSSPCRPRRPISSFSEIVADPSESLLKVSASQVVQTLSPPPLNLLVASPDPKPDKRDLAGVDTNGTPSAASLTKQSAPSEAAFKLPRGQSYVQVFGTPKYLDEWLMIESTAEPTPETTSSQPESIPHQVFPDLIQSSTSLTVLPFSTTTTIAWNQTSQDFTIDRWFKQAYHPPTPSP